MAAADLDIKEPTFSTKDRYIPVQLPPIVPQHLEGALLSVLYLIPKHSQDQYPPLFHLAILRISIALAYVRLQ